MSSYQHENRNTIVAHARSTARAEFVQMTLAAHGISAVLTASSIYPSIDFVEGRAVSVQIENEGRAREILKTLGLDDEPPPGDQPSPEPARRT